MPSEAAPSRHAPAAAARRASPSAGECGVKDQVSRSGIAPVAGAILGPTATGKTALAVALARLLDLDLVSVDAMAVYRGLDVGTAKPSPAERAGVTWHLLDLVDASEPYSVAQFQAEARRVLDGLAARRRRALLVGGTGLYLRAVLDGLELPGRYPAVAAALEAEAAAVGVAPLYERLRVLDPTAASRIEPGNRRRIVRALEVSIGSGRPFSSYGPGLTAYPPATVPLVGLRLGRAALARRIAQRLERQLAAGFVAEVEALARRPEGISLTARQALGYRELLRHLEEGLPLDQARAEILRRTRRLARRQEAWFRRDPRVVWLDADRPDLLDAAAALVDPTGSGRLRGTMVS
ncbi:MAG TPA: tRNA (adenosine(37)-N6)-dimethylallyltransferase MiaA [Acidimicrobiales bacterium]|nr:tRNA (adenosine(37)-N6)-dimethylallyltransferase MiaA [Acidimicrobiales bacterium]